MGVVLESVSVFLFCPSCHFKCISSEQSFVLKLFHVSCYKKIAPLKWKFRVYLNCCCLFSVSSPLFCSFFLFFVCVQCALSEFFRLLCVWYCESKQRWTRSCTNLWRGPTPAWSSVTPAHLKKRMVPTFITNTTERRTPAPIMSLTADSPTTATKSAGNPWSTLRTVGPSVCVCQDCFTVNCKNVEQIVFWNVKNVICF